MAILKELIVKYKGDTKDLESATNRAKDAMGRVDEAAKNVSRSNKSAFNLTPYIKGIQIAALAYGALAFSNKEVREEAGKIGTEVKRLIQDLDKAVGASKLMLPVLQNVRIVLTAVRARVRVIGDAFRVLFREATIYAQKFLNMFSRGIESLTFGMRKAKSFNFADNLINEGSIKDIKTYQEHLEDIFDENIKLDLQEKKSSSNRKKNISDSIKMSKDHARAVDDVGESWQRVADALEKQRERMRDLRTETADLVSDAVLGVRSLREIALSAIQDIFRNLVRINFGGSPSSGIFGTIASVLMGGSLSGVTIPGTGSSSYVNASGTPVPGVKPSRVNFANGGSFMVQGNSGIDRNTLSLNGQAIANVSKGETVAVSKASGGVTVNQTINVTTGVQQTVQAEITRFLPRFKQLSVEAVGEAQYRGQL